MKNAFARMIAILLLVVLLPGCGRRQAFSAEEAALQYGMEGWDEGALIDKESTQVRQIWEMDADTKLVFFTFSRKTIDRPERCMMLYETDRELTGFWTLGLGGGACTGPIEGAEEMPAFDSSWEGIQDTQIPGAFTFYAYGQVHDERIVKIRLTWDDESVTESELINSSYLAARDGKFAITLVEGLGADGNVVYAEEVLVPKR